MEAIVARGSFLRRRILGIPLSGMGAFVPFGEHGRDEITFGTSITPAGSVHVAHVISTPAWAPYQHPHDAKDHEKQEQGHQKAQEAKPKEWVEERPGIRVDIPRNRLGVGAAGDGG